MRERIISIPEIKDTISIVLNQNTLFFPETKILALYMKVDKKVNETTFLYEKKGKDRNLSNYYSKFNIKIESLDKQNLLEYTKVWDYQKKEQILDNLQVTIDKITTSDFCKKYVTEIECNIQGKSIFLFELYFHTKTKEFTPEEKNFYLNINEFIGQSIKAEDFIESYACNILDIKNIYKENLLCLWKSKN